MVSGQQNSYITTYLDSWAEYSEDNKKYTQTSAHTEVLEAIFLKRETRE